MTAHLRTVTTYVATKGNTKRVISGPAQASTDERVTRITRDLAPIPGMSNVYAYGGSLHLSTATA